MKDALKEAKLDLLARCAPSTEVCAKVFFPEQFNLPFSQNHLTAMAALDDPSITRLAIVATRGWGKTSIIQRAYVARHILFHKAKFMAVVSATSTQSEMQSESLKRELTSNSVMKKLGFINLESDTWSRDFWTCLGTAVMPRGYGQQIRGQLYNNDRPDLIVVDDLETSEGVMSDEQRAKKKEWFYGDVVGSVDSAKYNKIVYIGNMLHEDCLLANLLDDPAWTSFRFPMADDELQSLWPEKYSNKYIQELYTFYKNQHLLDVFYREYMCQSMAREGAPFERGCFHYYKPADLETKFVEFVVLVDPAKSVGSNACDTAIVGVGVDALNNKFYVHDIDYGHWHPNEIVDNAINMCKRLNARALGVEEAGSAEFISWPMRNELKRRAANIEYVKLTPRKGPSQYVPNGSSQQGKDSRIGHALVGLYRNGLVYHNEAHVHMPQLERQLLEFPRGKRKDIIDALSYIAQIMDLGERYFAARSYLSDDVQELGPGRLDTEYEERRLAELCKGDMPCDDRWQV